MTASPANHNRRETMTDSPITGYTTATPFGCCDHAHQSTRTAARCAKGTARQIVAIYGAEIPIVAAHRSMGTVRPGMILTDGSSSLRTI